ncbi:helix-turn-helix domain-containing protein [Rhizohabitans arisaemae]|uniref:helix-turn-helix domain-containing protein n=1 Tax=Rhizohabitans arisaemae TaxID=2720610 RepID=UPI0024B120C5|nr:helix-turn-helix transcriptional regulator [Rhizohabitans arisaemae]
MHEHLDKPLTIDDMASTAMFSKFHFSRVFQRVTGLSPGRFLSALRIQEAKRLLVTTSSTVTEISHMVGYSSVGTFSSRFTSSVGTAPSMYRELRSVVPRELIGYRRDLKGLESARIEGEVASPLGGRPVFVGLFPNRILEGWPVRYTVLNKPGSFVLEDVPEGSWHVLTQSVVDGREDAFDHPPGGDTALFVGHSGPIVINGEAAKARLDVRLRPMKPLDAPSLLALRDLVR